MLKPITKPNPVTLAHANPMANIYGDMVAVSADMFDYLTDPYRRVEMGETLLKELENKPSYAERLAARMKDKRNAKRTRTD